MVNTLSRVRTSTIVSYMWCLMNGLMSEVMWCLMNGLMSEVMWCLVNGLMSELSPR